MDIENEASVLPQYRRNLETTSQDNIALKHRRGAIPNAMVDDDLEFGDLDACTVDQAKIEQYLTFIVLPLPRTGLLTRLPTHRYAMSRFLK